MIERLIIIKYEIEFFNGCLNSSLLKSFIPFMTESSVSSDQSGHNYER